VGREPRERADVRKGAAAAAFAKRGTYRPMQYLNALIGITFIVISLIHAPLPDPFSWVPYSIAAVLAFVSLKSEISLPISRVLAIGTTVLMFIFFAGFFVVVPSLEADWYLHQDGWEAVTRILGAFAMIPILSDYSCRLKAECREARLRGRGRHAFFSVPDHIRPR